jgi:hypothetical protein
MTILTGKVKQGWLIALVATGIIEGKGSESTESGKGASDNGRF